MKVDINADNRHVVIDVESQDITAVTGAALDLWIATEKTVEEEESPGPAVGFTVERRPTPSVPPLTSYMRDPVA